MDRAFRWLCVVPLVLFTLMLAANDVLAQGGSTAQISGTVKDESGGLLPGADVTATQGTRYLNPAAFAIPGVGTLGNLPANSIIGPGNRVLDVALVRAFRFGTTQTLEARVEAFNALNWFRPGTDKTPLQAPIVTVNSQTFGQILEAADPRIMQFAVKFGF